MTDTFPVEYTQSKGYVTNNSPAERVETENTVSMTVDTTGLPHIMSLLTDLYSDPNTAVIREYTTNAIDSHIEANQTRAVEITGPTLREPFFSVQDFGVGMSLDDIKYLYSSYGRSTKRENFTQAGAFGLGSKSGLAVSSSFQVRSVRDGEAVTATVARDDEGVGSVTIDKVEKTSEENGTKVTIPIGTPGSWSFDSDVQSFRDALTRFDFTGFPTGSVSIDGNVRTHVADLENATKWLSDTVIVASSDQSRQYVRGVFVVMGGVVYPVDQQKVDFRQNLKFVGAADIYLKVPVASLDLTPSREALRYSSRTLELLTKMRDAALSEFKKKFYDGLANQSTLKGAVDYLSEMIVSGINLHSISEGKDFTWNGIDIPNSLSVGSGKVDFSVFEVSYDRTRAYQTSYIPFAKTSRYMADFVFVDASGMTPSQFDKYRRNYRKYVLNKEESPNARLVLMNRIPEIPFFSEEIVGRGPSLEDVLTGAEEYDRAHKTTRKGASGPRGPVNTKYKVTTVKRDGSVEITEYPAKNIPVGTFYFKEGQYTKLDANTVASFLNFLNEESVDVVVIPHSRKLSTFLDRVKTDVMPLNSWIEESLTEYADESLPDDWNTETYDSYGVCNSIFATYGKIGDQTIDPYLQEVSKKYRKHLEHSGVVDKILQYCRYFGTKMPTKVIRPVEKPYDLNSAITLYISSNYPLLSYLGTSADRDSSALVNTINAIYTYTQVGKGGFVVK